MGHTCGRQRTGFARSRRVIDGLTSPAANSTPTPSPVTMTTHDPEQKYWDQ
ncbi:MULTISPECIES: hypothetical protein [unclassified Leptolyngbya]|uniref:hypothetical protein n=1 Tax=unclassified Leptolyngbya TaxID=2650499 RepID=UPI0016880AEA|nr:MULTISPECIES: hypothetical protein [unclassified Leptolyngbya]MBD1913294.1 hypothetical protein [Leptolyngbya sp. FACHB-8]MBD2154383.1 hypothetical protein [Leptolyngbya sp. FACHB-16]